MNTALDASRSLPTTALRLSCHPAHPCGVALDVSASLALAGSTEGPGLLLEYRVQGDIASLDIPATTFPAATDGLWQHTCFEAFVAPRDSTAYREFNFSPSGEWAAYRFLAERQRDDATVEAFAPPHIELTRDEHQLVLIAWLSLQSLPVTGTPLQIGLSAVIETRDGQLSYWALQHPWPQRPDFHHRSGFVLDMDLPLPPLPHPTPSA